MASLFPKAKGNRLAVKNINAGNLFWFVNSDSGVRAKLFTIRPE
ncbi:hypothetical protein ALT1000_640001 [Alteromonas macleodii]